MWSSQILQISCSSNIKQLFVFWLFFTALKRPIPIAFEEFKSYNGHQWKQWVSSKLSFKNSRTSQLKEEDVNIIIGLMEWRNNDCVFKPKRGKGMQLRVSNMVNATNILVKVEVKWEQYKKDLYDSYGDYKLFFKNGEEVNKLSGTSIDFVLWKFKNELGKDYKRTVFYLCKGNDYQLSERLKDGNLFCSSEEEEIWLKKPSLFKWM